MKEKETKVVEKENVIYLEREFVRVNGKVNWIFSICKY